MIKKCMPKPKLRQVLFWIVISLALLSAITTFRTYFLKKSVKDCSFKEFSNQKIIPTLQQIPSTSIIVYSEKNKNVIQMFDAEIFKSAILEKINTDCRSEVYKKNNRSDEDIAYYVRTCERDKKNWNVVNSFIDFSKKTIDYEELHKKIKNYHFSGENDEDLILLELSSLISYSFESGNVTLQDLSGKIVNSMIYKEEGMANCYDMSRSYTYELPDGTVFIDEYNRMP